MQYMLTHVVGIGGSADEYDRKILGIRTAYPIECGEGTDTVGNNANTNPMATGVTFGGKGAVELICAPNLSQRWMRFKFIKEDEVLVSWNNEMMTDIKLGNPLCEVITHGERRHGNGCVK
jgi:hypothetical protein